MTICVFRKEWCCNCFFHLGKCIYSGLRDTAGLCPRLGTSVFITLSKTAAFYSVLMPLATKCHWFLHLSADVSNKSVFLKLDILNPSKVFFSTSTSSNPSC